MASRSYKFKLSDKFMDDLNKIIREYSYSRLIYNNENNLIIGYVTFEESIRMSTLYKFSDKIEWMSIKSNLIKKLDKNDFIHYHIKSRKKTQTELLLRKIDNLEEKFNEQNALIQQSNNFQKQNIQQQTIQQIQQTQINNFNINLNSYKDPSTDHMKNRDFMSFLDKSELNGISDFIEKMYFKNKNNFSLFIEDDKYNKICVFYNNKWITQKRDTVIDDIFKICSYKLNSWFEDVSGETIIEDDEEFPITIETLDEDQIEETKNKVDEKRDLLENGYFKEKDISNIRLLVVNNSSKVKRLSFKPIQQQLGNN